MNRILPPITRSIATDNIPTKNLVETEDLINEAQYFIDEGDTLSYVPKEIKARKEEVDRLASDPYPRYVRDESRHRSLYNYHNQYSHLRPGKLYVGGEQVEVEGNSRPPKSEQVGIDK